MSTRLQSFHYHVGEDAAAGHDETSRSPESFRGRLPAGMAEEAPAQSFNSNEAAARYFLDQLLQRDDRPAMRSLVEPERPEVVPGLIVESEEDLRALGTHQLRFAQTHQGIPIFGASAVVELTGARDLVSVSAQLDEVSGVSPVESLSRAEALDRVAQYTGVAIPPEAGVSGRLNFYKDVDSGAWHLAWFFTGLPAEPPNTSDDTDVDTEALLGHGLGRRPIPSRVNYLVDAHDGQILFCYSAVPTALPTPTRCTGFDEDEKKQTFFGQLAASTGTTCRLSDPLRAVRTYDLKFADIDDDPPIPVHPVEAATSDYGTTNRAAVSAHHNAARVQDSTSRSCSETALTTRAWHSSHWSTSRPRACRLLPACLTHSGGMARCGTARSCGAAGSSAFLAIWTSSGTNSPMGSSSPHPNWCTRPSPAR